MKYRVGRKQKRAILTEKGLEVVVFNKGQEQLASLVCELLNQHELQLATQKLFELSWSWYEDYSYYLFIHNNKTEEQFKHDVKFLLIKYGKDYLDSEKSWVGANGWVDFVVDKMPELGYQPILPITEGFRGAYIIEGNEGDDKEWGKVVGEELLQEAILQNKKLREEID